MVSSKGNIRALIIFALLNFTSCEKKQVSEKPQFSFVISESIGTTSQGEIIYKVFEKPGEDLSEFKYDFFRVAGQDTTSLFSGRHYGYVYYAMEWFITENNPFIQIKGNRNITWNIIYRNGHFFELLEKNQPLEGLGFSGIAGTNRISQNLFYPDTLRRPLTAEEEGIHNMVWRAKKVRNKYFALGEDYNDLFTIISQLPSEREDYYIVDFKQIMREHLELIDRYRVSTESKAVEVLTEHGKWLSVEVHENLLIK